VATPPTHRRADPAGELGRLDRATADLDPPFALVDLEAFEANARELARRAAGKPIRIASKSVRSRRLMERALSHDGFRGVLAFTLPEALWLAEGGLDDIVVAYPSVDRAALRRLAGTTGETGSRITIMVDSLEHLEVIDAAAGTRVSPIRLAIDIDAGLWLLNGRLQIGAKRSPVHTTEQASALAKAIVERDGFRLVGLMAYESQIAGVGDSPPGKFGKASVIRRMQRMSYEELLERRAAIVAAVERHTPLEFVNGGGTGSVELTARDPSVTEIAAGSGLYAPVLFDYYRAFTLRPAALFALPVVRRPRREVVTVLGGGYLASGPSDSLRLPRPYLPTGLRLDRQEGAGEVQTPVIGTAAENLRIGDRVYFRHAKAGELCERFDVLHLIAGERVVESVPTYRGEGRTFL
jgi:D-serine deaminase-like pyridoxal phosphate-dependent protein